MRLEAEPVGVGLGVLRLPGGGSVDEQRARTGRVDGLRDHLGDRRNRQCGALGAAAADRGR
jgi:hypothetical protein